MAQSSPFLLGPPEIYQPAATRTRTPTPTRTITTTSGDPFVDLIVANYNKTANQKSPPMGSTENCSPTFLSTGNPCLDFFYHVVPDTPREALIRLLQFAWDHDQQKALKLVCNLRGIRGTGKSDKEGFYTAALWLHKNHPKTLASNVASLAEFGYFKDLLEILFRLLEGSDARELSERRKGVKQSQKRRGDISPTRSSDSDSDYCRSPTFRSISTGCCSSRRSGKALSVQQRRRRRGVKVEAPKLTREEKRIEKAKRVVERFNRDPDFKFLHERVSHIFAQCLRSDMRLLDSGDLYRISQAAKWCPSLDSSFDRITLLCETIAKKVFPKEEYPEYEGIEEAHYAYRVRDRLRKEVLVPLRKAIQLPEIYIGANEWSSIPYEMVGADAMIRYKEEFLKHDKERFQEYLVKVKSGEAKIAATALLPHEIIAAAALDGGGEVAELLWKRMVDDLSKKGKLRNCIAIIDVSKNMRGVLMEVSMALGVLMSELSEGPWKGKLITFSDNPKLQIVEGVSLREKVEYVKRMKSMSNIHSDHHKDLQKVFDVLLKVAEKGKVRGEEMIKRVFVFSDMEFEQASTYRSHRSMTDYQEIVSKFKEKGYGDSVPEIVFWNLRFSKATPVPANQGGVALVGGFAENLFSLFLENNGGESLDPEAVMDAAISGEDYQKLLVVD